MHHIQYHTCTLFSKYLTDTLADPRLLNEILLLSQRPQCLFSTRRRPTNTHHLRNPLPDTRECLKIKLSGKSRCVQIGNDNRIHRDRVYPSGRWGDVSRQTKGWKQRGASSKDSEIGEMRKKMAEYEAVLLRRT